MAQTPLRAWPYAGPNDVPDVPYWVQRLAEKGDAELKDVWAAIATTPVAGTMRNSWIAYGLGFEVLTFQKVGRLVSVTGLIKPGTISSGVIVADLPAGMVPTLHQNQPIGAAAGSAYSTAVATFGSDGTIKVYGIPAGVTYLMFNNTYLVP